MAGCYPKLIAIPMQASKKCLETENKVNEPKPILSGKLFFITNQQNFSIETAVVNEPLNIFNFN